MVRANWRRAEFRLQMNTGAILTFTFEDKREVRRSDTGIFRQVNPGLVLLLLGETDDEGLPTGTRTLVTAVYPVEQELGTRWGTHRRAGAAGYCSHTDTPAHCYTDPDPVHRFGRTGRQRHDKRGTDHDTIAAVQRRKYAAADHAG